MPNWCNCGISFDFTHNKKLFDKIEIKNFIDSDNQTKYELINTTEKYAKKYAKEYAKKKTDDDFWVKLYEKQLKDNCCDYEVMGENYNGVKILGQYMFNTNISKDKHRLSINGDLRWGPENNLIKNVLKYARENGIECVMSFSESGCEYAQYFKLKRKLPNPTIIKYIQNGLKNNEPLLQQNILNYMEPEYEDLINISANFDDYDSDTNYGSDKEYEEEEYDYKSHNNRYNYLRNKNPDYPDLAESWGFYE